MSIIICVAFCTACLGQFYKVRLLWHIVVFHIFCSFCCDIRGSTYRTGLNIVIHTVLFTIFYIHKFFSNFDFNPLMHGWFSDPYIKVLCERNLLIFFIGAFATKSLKGQEFSGIGCPKVFWVNGNLDENIRTSRKQKESLKYKNKILLTFLCNYVTPVTDWLTD